MSAVRRGRSLRVSVVGRSLVALMLAMVLVDAAGTAEVDGKVVTESRGRGSEAIDWIERASDRSIVRGDVVRKIVIKGEVVTRTTGSRGHACTSIGSVGSCAGSANGDSRLPRLGNE